jgi:two-component system KDP operon response regulator KdpE
VAPVKRPSWQHGSPIGSEVDSTTEAGRTPRRTHKRRGPMSNATILVVDDEPQIRRVLQATLTSNGYDVIEAKNGKEAITVRDEEQDKVVAFDSGADDYVVKPFGVSELLARIRAALRRSSPDEHLPKVDTPEFSVDFGMRLVAVRGQRVNLSLKEFEVLRALAQQEGKPLTHERLSKIVWGPGHPENTENLRTVISQLRKKLEKDPAHPRYILTEPWFGYRFQPPSPASPKAPLRPRKP